MEFSRSESVKRDDYLGWHDFFMATVFLVAKRSKDPVTQVGACIVNPEKKIVGTGYNGMPNGCSDDLFPWGKGPGLKTKHMYVVHAEVNAILNKNSSDVKGCSMYVALFPCNECAKIIIQAGIKEIIYLSDKHSRKDQYKAAKKMFMVAGVEFWQYEPRQTTVTINFLDIEKHHKVPESPPNSPLTLSNLKIVEDFKGQDRDHSLKVSSS